jgi:16S rRNA C967 or C1407 C5-methylase (RsmB/RsmF family)/NOL1/NOP2/fmu family ribosome biogenesis protein
MSFLLSPNFLDHIQHLPGLDEPQFVLAHQNPAPTSIRLNPEKASSIFQDAKHVSWCEHGRYLESRPDFTLDPLFHAGAYYVQEASSMSIWSALNDLVPEKKDLRILDLCAAPGGKSTLIASWLAGEGLLVANEVIRSRAGILTENLNRWGSANIVVSNNDPRQFGKLEGYFDVIVVDAPCSGSGMFRKDHSAMDHWSEDAVIHCAARQERILADVWPALKEGGLLLYSTCSYSEAEDENMSTFVSNELQGEIVTIPSLESLSGIVKTPMGYRFYPGQIDGEGFYLSAIRKTSEAEIPFFKQTFRTLSIPAQVAQWIAQPEAFLYSETHLGAGVIPMALDEAIPPLLKHLHILKCGVIAGEMKGKDFIPSHEMALSSLLRKDIPQIELERDEALHYLKKEALHGRSDCKGWHRMNFQGLGLGWGNILPNRINNALPKSWRILKELE